MISYDEMFVLFHCSSSDCVICSSPDSFYFLQGVVHKGVCVCVRVSPECGSTRCLLVYLVKW